MDITSLKVVDLQRELKSRGLDAKGTKGILVQRLKEAMEKENQPAPAEAITAQAKVEGKPVEADTASHVVEIDTKKNPEPQENDQDINNNLPHKKPSELSDAERLKQRIAKFGVVTEKARKQLRAERFGIVSEEEKLKQEEERKRKRSERFGIVSEEEKKQQEEEKKQARAQRFGIVTEEEKQKVDEDKKRARAERFGIQTPQTPAEQEEKKRKRALRFGTTEPKKVQRAQKVG
eukprot:TRINITY_DN3764_c0_g1_i1.p1 TRINITY_DN3764_c0_g1~~TRINITY_DN3764_c0_g1_i1.p1  ORF type:complete len:234 (-),score=89.05 TRINITY_DN3764_c0_g1_i1:219-920(-)